MNLPNILYPLLQLLGHFLLVVDGCLEGLDLVSLRADHLVEAVHLLLPPPRGCSRLGQLRLEWGQLVVSSFQFGLQHLDLDLLIAQLEVQFLHLVLLVSVGGPGLGELPLSPTEGVLSERESRLETRNLLLLFLDGSLYDGDQFADLPGVSHWLLQFPLIAEKFLPDVLDGLLLHGVDDLLTGGAGEEWLCEVVRCRDVGSVSREPQLSSPVAPGSVFSAEKVNKN